MILKLPYLFETYHQLIHGDTSKGLDEHNLEGETTNILQTIDRELFEVRSIEDAQFYVQKIELAVAHMLTSIQDQLEINDSISKEKLLDHCKKGLEELQHHLESTYSIYRDSSKSVSKKLIRTLSASFKEKASSIKDHLEQKEINPNLSTIILHPIQELTKSSDIQISMYRIEYL